MRTRPFYTAFRAKGIKTLLARLARIARHYGPTAHRMNRSMEHFFQILNQFNIPASFPVTALTLEQNPHITAWSRQQHIELLVHGYNHIDYTLLDPEQQARHLRQACHIFTKMGLPIRGFRSPYLRRNHNLYAAIRQIGFSYVSNQPILWNVPAINTASFSDQDSYSLAISFYEPEWGHKHTSLPRLIDNLVEIPVSLPDDEMLVDRLNDGHGQLVKEAWQFILSETYRRGELFTLQLHPERTTHCKQALSSVLTQALSYEPAVWITRLEEIDAWWRIRQQTQTSISAVAPGQWRLSVKGPSQMTLLIKGTSCNVPTRPWADGYQIVPATECIIESPQRPCIGVAPDSPIADFLRQQGYIVETSLDRQAYVVYLDQTRFELTDELPLLQELESSSTILTRLARWPHGARSALCITGDIDALTWWDYIVRLKER